MSRVAVVTGATGAGGVEDESPETWRRILDVNITGATIDVNGGQWMG